LNKAEARGANPAAPIDPQIGLIARDHAKPTVALVSLGT
jgi:hypothetical protein